MDQPGLATATPSPLDRARHKAYRRLIPLVFASYVIAYVDRTNVSLAVLEMRRSFDWLTDSVYARAAGIFFLGYFLLEVPGTLLVEKWSARKWLGRIMISWGVVAALTALIRSAVQFQALRFLLGLAEAGFFPGVIVYFTHWFPVRDRARALSQFLIAPALAGIITPKISNWLLRIGTTETIHGVTVNHPAVAGLVGWQWMYIFWGIPAVALGLLVLFGLPDRPAHARWLSPEEREALEQELARERAEHGANIQHVDVLHGLLNARVLLLALAYFFAVTANYGVELFLPRILQSWYGLSRDQVTSWVVLPQVALLLGILLVGWHSDRTRERWFHAAVPMLIGAAAVALTPWSRGTVVVTVLFFCLTMAGVRAYLPAFWCLPNLFLADAAAAGSIGLINSVGNLGGFLGPNIVAAIQKTTGSFEGGMMALGASVAAAGLVVLGLRQLHRRTAPVPAVTAQSLPR
jgi:ACS family tartrate transporter-like MFS transporter